MLVGRARSQRQWNRLQSSAAACSAWPTDNVTAPAPPPRRSRSPAPLLLSLRMYRNRDIHPPPAAFDSGPSTQTLLGYGHFRRLAMVFWPVPTTPQHHSKRGSGRIHRILHAHAAFHPGDRHHGIRRQRQTEILRCKSAHDRQPPGSPRLRHL